MLLADAIIGTELQDLLVHVLCRQEGKHLREVLGSPPRAKKVAVGPPEEVASRLTNEARLQLLLVISDQHLIKAIDALVEQKRISIPSGEVREAKQAPGRISYADSYCELSSNGIRSVRVNPIVNLNATVWHTYNSLDLVNDLNWRVRSHPGMSPRMSLAAFIQDKGPYSAVRELIMGSRPVVERICGELDLELPEAGADEEIVIGRMLWKLGFDMPRHDAFAARFAERLKKFREMVILQSPIESEEDRESIRGCGVNLFVSVEEFVEQLISYNVWFLSQDHFLRTNFQYCPHSALATVSSILGEVLRADQLEFRWSAAGENTLGVLARYLDECVNWMSSLEWRDREQYIRHPDDLPHYVDDPLLYFPFRHTQLWADADLRELKQHVEGFCKIAKSLSQANLASIRNGLEHKRAGGKFPETDTMIVCAARLQESFDWANVNRYIPKAFWLAEQRTDFYGKSTYTYEDKSGHEILIDGPFLVLGLPRDSFSSPRLVPPTNILGLPNSWIRLGLRETSNYSRFWEKYPRRRIIAFPSAAMNASSRGEDPAVQQKKTDSDQET